MRFNENIMRFKRANEVAGYKININALIGKTYI